MKQAILFISLMATMFMTSCVNNKEMIYLQGADTLYA